MWIPFRKSIMLRKTEIASLICRFGIVLKIWIGAASLELGRIIILFLNFQSPKIILWIAGCDLDCCQRRVRFLMWLFFGALVNGLKCTQSFLSFQLTFTAVSFGIDSCLDWQLLSLRIGKITVPSFFEILYELFLNYLVWRDRGLR